MARDLKESIDALNSSIRSWVRLPAGSFSTPVVGQANRMPIIESGVSFQKRAGMVELQKRIEADYEIIKKSDKLFRAQEFMASHPGAFRSAERKVRYDEIMSERRKRDRIATDEADKAIRLKTLSITDPDAYERAVLEERFRSATGGGGFAADTIINAERSNKAKELHKERRKRDRMKEIAGDQAYAFDSLGDYEQEVKTLSERYGGGVKGKNRAEDRLRQDALKKLPGFFKMFNMSNKSLYEISQNTRGMPIIGSLIKASKNPITGAGMVIGGWATTLSIADAANTAQVNANNAMNLYGKPSESLQNAGTLAGLKDPGEIARRAGRMTLKYGDADTGYRIIGGMMRGMDSRTKTFFAQSQGLDETDVMIAEQMSGRSEKPDTNSRSRRINSYKNKIEKIREFGFSSDAGLLDSEFWQALWYSIPGMASSAARDAALYENGDLDKDYNDMIHKMEGAKNAASSADRYDAGDFASAAPTDGTEGGKGTNSTVTVILQTEDGKVISKRTMAAGKKFEDRVAIADMFDIGGQ